MHICLCEIYATCVEVPEGGQKRALNPLELEVQVVVSHLLWGHLGRARSEILMKEENYH